MTSKLYQHKNVHLSFSMTSSTPFQCQTKNIKNVWPKNCSTLESAITKVGNAMITINLIDGFKDAMKSQARV